MSANTRFLTLDIIPPIDKVGFQIRKDSSTFSDMKTGSIPQIDAVIKTADNRIYKSTQNLNSTYTDADGNSTTTKNAAEPLGASMNELFMKEYEKTIVSNTDIESDIIYDGEKFIVCGYDTFAYSKDGANWYDCTIPESAKAYVWTSLAFTNSKYVAVSSTRDLSYSSEISTNDLNTTEYSNKILYSTDGITWSETSVTTKQSWQSVCYGNGKFVAVGYTFDSNGSDYPTQYIPSKVAAYSLDGITWAEFNMPTSKCWRSICYANNKFVAASGDSTIAYSTNGSSGWTEVTVPNTHYAAYVTYVLGKFVLVSRYDGIISSSTDGISWTNLEQDYRGIIDLTSNGISKGSAVYNSSDWETQYPNTFMTHIAQYDDTTAIGYFALYDNYKTARFVIAKSGDLKTWETAYEIPRDTSFVPNNIICNDARVITIGSVYNYDNQWGLVKEVAYDWSTSGSTVALSSDKELPAIEPGRVLFYDDSVSIDTTYSAGDTDPHEDQNGGYVFSGWDKTGEITLTPESDFRTVVSGIWEWKNFYRYSYSWNADTYSDLNVTLPTGDYVPSGSLVNVDNSYNSNSTENGNLGTWTESTMPSSQSWGSICYGNGKFVAIANNTDVFAYSTDGIDWTTGVMPSSQSWGSICYGNGKFVAITYNSATFAYSTNGIEWTQGTMPNTRYWNSLCYGNGKYIAVTNSNVFAYSTDCINWIEGTMPSSKYWSSVCYGNGKFVAISGGLGTAYNVFAYSTNGIEWTEGTMPSTQIWRSICYGNGKFVAIASNSNTFVYSTDGINWIEGTMPSSQAWQSICYCNGRFIVIAQSSGIFAYSTDGINWSQGTMPDTRIWYSGCYGNNKFVAIIVNSDEYAYFTPNNRYYSFSGWNKSDFNITSNTTISGTWSKKNMLSVAYSWSGAPSNLVATVPEINRFMLNALVYVDTNYNNKTYKKAAPVWTEGTMPSTQIWRSICYGNGKFVAIASNSNTFVYSTDGINWIEGTMPSSQAWQSICYGNGKFVAVAYKDAIAYSTDGINWNNSNDISVNGSVLSDLNWSSVCYGNGKFVAVSSDQSNIVAYSTDGITWSVSIINTSIGLTWSSVCYGNGKFVAVSFDQRKIVAYSTDGINWSQGTMPNEDDWASVCYGNGKFVAVGNNVGWLAYSTNGIDWTTGVMPSSQSWGSVCYGNGMFVGVPDRTNNFAYSIDGVNWTERAMPNSQAWQSICYGNGKFVAVTNSNVFAYLNDSEFTSYYNFSGWNKSGSFNITSNTTITGTWNKVYPYKWNELELPTTTSVYQTVYYVNGKYLVLGRSDKILYSTDSINWTEYSMPSNQNWQQICYGNGKFVVIVPNSTVTAYSTDGITWSQGALPNDNYWNTICYGNGKFVVIASSTNIFAYSTDGISWSQGTFPKTQSWISICYADNKFVVINDNEKYGIYSTDGINWSQMELTTESPWSSICYGNGKFVISSMGGHVAYSTDGITWNGSSTVIEEGLRLYRICYGNGKFVSASLGSNKFVYSTDGISWSMGTMPSSQNWTSICNDGKKFIAIGYSNTKLTYSTMGLPEDAIVIN